MNRGSVRKRAKEILREGIEISSGISEELELHFDEVFDGRIEGVLQMLRPLHARPRLTIYRAVTVFPGQWLELSKLGIYWTWEKDYAQSYWARPARFPEPAPEDTLLRAVVARSSIDWNTSAALLVLRGEDELEIRVKRGAKVFLETVNGERYDAWGKA